MLAGMAVVLQLNGLIVAYKPESRTKVAIDAYICARKNNLIRKEKEIGKRFLYRKSRSICFGKCRIEQ